MHNVMTSGNEIASASTHTVQATAGEAVVTRANWLPSMTAALLGALIIAAVGFAPGIAHLAGHDVRHTMVYPCH